MTRPGRYIAFAVFGLLLITPSLFAQVIGASAISQYQSINGLPSIDLNMNPDPLIPVVAGSVAKPRGTPFDSALGWAAAMALPGGAGLYSYSRASGSDPQHGPPDGIKAETYAFNSTFWEPTSSTLPAGTQIWVSAVMAFQGTLGAANFFDQGTDLVTANVEASLTLNDNNTLYSASAKVDAQQPGHGAPVLTTTGNWDDADFAPTKLHAGPYGKLDGYAIRMMDVALFPAWIGVPFRLDFNMRTKAEAVGPYEAWGQADFGNGSYYFLKDLGRGDVAFSTVNLGVPEPSTAFLVIATALLPLVRRRR